MTTYNVNPGVTSGGITLGNGDFLYVSSGGIANTTTVNNGGTATVFVDSVISDAVINFRGKLFVSSGGVASATLVNNGSVVVSSGGLASFSVVSAGGAQVVGAGGVASGTIVNAGS